MRGSRSTVLALLAALIALGIASADFAMSAHAQEGKFALTSPAFRDGESIPSKYTCDGNDLVPPLSWSGTPAQTRSLALIVDDPDVPDPAAPSGRGSTGWSTTSRRQPPVSPKAEVARSFPPGAKKA